MNKQLLPSLDPKNHIDDGGEIKELKYRVGSPRAYRFDAGKGVINIDGEENITKAGDAFEFIPVAIRIFNGDLFRQGVKNWAEIFFINAKNQMCSILIHGYSVDNLGLLANKMYYDDLSITDCVVSLKPVQRENSAGDKFYIAEFSIVEAPEETISTFDTLLQGLPIYRNDTISDGLTMIEQLNYNPPALPPGNVEDQVAADLETAQ